jgi:energy-converting hydrogenase Eha subunit H
VFSFIGILPLPTSCHSFSSINNFGQVSIHSVFASFFIGLEILGIALYALIAYPRRRVDSLEAGIKYLVLAAASAAFLLFGMALIYMDTGSLAFARMTFLTGALTATGARPLMLAGAAMLVAFLTGAGPWLCRRSACRAGWCWLPRRCCWSGWAFGPGLLMVMVQQMAK